MPGHIMEIGVASGRNAVLFGNLIKLFDDGARRQYLGFDTFDGYVERDMKLDSGLKTDAWTDRACSYASVSARIMSAGLEDVVDLFEGDATETVRHVLKELRGKKFKPDSCRVALLYIDCNAYEPAIATMRAAKKYMSPGAIIAIDEKLMGGEMRALQDFAAEQGLTVTKPVDRTFPTAMIRVEL
ncbi:class I SAM-dependent methyltransferase [Luminiphilus sp.]|nr:class I SAM-dependent methyltransferase [Luminiphilus sp.]